MNYRHAMNYILYNRLFEPWDTDTRISVETEFRQKFPGNYSIIWDEAKISEIFNKLDYYYFYLKFNDPQEEVIWRLCNE